jgi:DNA polymerase-3 subunit beta
MMIFTTEKNNSIRLTFEDNSLTVTAQTPDIGEAEDKLAIKYAGPTISVIFNPAFIEEPLKTLADDEVFFELNDANSPGLIKDSSAFHYVIMPLRV